MTATLLGKCSASLKHWSEVTWDEATIRWAAKSRRAWGLSPNRRASAAFASTASQGGVCSMLHLWFYKVLSWYGNLVSLFAESELARLYRKKGEPVSSGPIIEARAKKSCWLLVFFRCKQVFCPEKTPLSRKARLGRRSLFLISIGISFLGQMSNSPTDRLEMPNGKSWCILQVLVLSEPECQVGTAKLW